MAEISVAFLSPAFFCLLDTGPGDDGSPRLYWTGYQRDAISTEGDRHQ